MQNAYMHYIVECKKNRKHSLYDFTLPFIYHVIISMLNNSWHMGIYITEGLFI